PLPGAEAGAHQGVRDGLLGEPAPTLLSERPAWRAGGLVAKTEAPKLSGSFQAALAGAVSNMDDAALFTLRSELSAIRAVVAGGKDKALATSVDHALASVSRFHTFASEVKGFVVSRDFSKKASLFDIGSIGVLALQNFLTAAPKSVFRLPMRGLSERLAFAPIRQDVYGSNAVLVAPYRRQRAALCAT